MRAWIRLAAIAFFVAGTGTSAVADEGDSDLPYEDRRLNAKEKELLRQDAVVGAKVLLAAKQAIDAATERYEPAQLNDGNGDAFRHAYWNALMVRSVGVEWAKRWADAHEEGDANNTALRKQMDQHNNQAGRDAAGRMAADERDAPGKVRSEVRAGKCRRISGARLVPTTNSGERP